MNRFLRPLVVAGALAAAASSASAAIFLFVPGVPGQSVDVRHQNWIDLSSFQIGVANRVCSGITVTKQIDNSSPVLSTAALLGGVYPTMTLDFTTGVDGRSYLTYVLSNATVTGVSQSSGGDLINESMSVYATSLAVTYRSQQPDGSAGTPVTYTLNCAARK
jgi:type VI protein secretion system component Hcp